MKVRKWSALVLFCGVASTFLQAQPVTQGVAGPDTNNVASVPYTVVGRAANSRRWGQVVTRTNSAGNVTVQTNAASYTEVSANLCFQDATGTWSDSDGSLHPVADGASSGNSPLAVHFSGDAAAAAGTVNLTDSDGKVFISKVFGISLYDPTVPTNILIGSLRSTQGTLVGQNHVLYANAFTGLNADLWYSYSLAGVSQDVVIHDFPAFPAGLNPQTSRIQIFTEWLNSPEPRKIEAVAGAMAYDDYLDFGNLQMVPGAALFTQGQADPAPVEAGKIFKHWGPIPGSPNVWLVEEINYPAVANLLQTLPLHAAAGTAHGSIYERIAASPPLRPKTGLEPGEPVLVAKSGRAPTGLILDYDLVSSVANFTFLGNQTYYVSSSATLNGTNTTMEGGAVIKYAAGTTLTVDSPVTCLSAPYRPFVMMAKDDNSLGNPIAGSTGSPSGYYANTAFYFNGAVAGSNLLLHDFRILNAQTAVAINGESNHVLSNAQMVKCGNGLATTNASFSFWNGLMYDVMTNFGGTNSTGDVEQLTADTASFLGNSQTLNLTNCLLVLVTNLATNGAIVATNYTFQTNVTSGVFTQAGGGWHYLPTNSIYLSAGTNGIAPALARSLAQLTTYPPVIERGWITSPTTWSPQAPRDSGTPAVGYHYYPLDYAGTNLGIWTTTLTLTNGVAVGVLGSAGLAIYGNLVSQGGPVGLDELTPAATAQEMATPEVTNLLAGNDTWAGISLRFTDLPTLGGATWLVYAVDDLSTQFAAGPISFRDCQLHGLQFYAALGQFSDAFGDQSALALNFTNNLLDRCNLSLYRNMAGPANLSWNSYNNLYHQCVATFIYELYATEPAPWGGPPQPPSWTFYDNLFEETYLTEGGGDPYGGGVWPAYVPNGYNGYIGTGALTASAGGDKTVATVDYQAGALGSYYYPTTGGNLSSLIHVGSTTAANLGLYHYTVTTNNAIEGTNLISIGFQGLWHNLWVILR